MYNFFLYMWATNFRMYTGFFFLSRDIFAKTITPVMETETIGLESPFELRRLYVIT